MKKSIFPLFLTLALMLSLMTGCRAQNSGTGKTSASPGPTALTLVSSYADLFSALQKAAAGPNGAYKTADTAAGTAAQDNGQTVSSSPEAIKEPTPTDADYSTTNVQVDGVDEGDIVKTDGQFIYVLRQNTLIIFQADGAATKQVSALKIGGDSSGNKTADGNYASESATELYVSGDTAAVVTSYSSYIPYLAAESGSADAKVAAGAVTTDIAPANNTQRSTLYLINISDKAHPTLKKSLGQDGYPLTSRLVGSTLYLISTYYVYTMDQNDPSTYVPRLYTDGKASLVEAGRISIMPIINSAAYTVLCAYNLDSGARDANESVMGGGSVVYMNKETLYLTCSTTEQTAGDPYTDSVYTVIDYQSESKTAITSFDISGGGLSRKAAGTVPGSLVNPYVLDASGGNLRVVTTTYSQSWSEYTDKAKGFINSIWKDPVSSNALFVLDGGLNAIGSVQDLSKGEQVYGVRFDGSIAYIVTFRQVDPLFAVDLTDPKNPTVLSALKIPGFSSYLHVYGEGRLFGLGMDADEKTGATSGMKLSMFDTTNPKDVTVKHTLKLKSSYSSALYNPRAILISPDKNIIAFPADNGYDIYGYSDAEGFYSRAHVDALDWGGDSRGLYIGQYAYIVDANAVYILDMTSFKLAKKLAYS
ncbi:beta-propeller domain-containing protein [Oscillospiraceae bacterium CM]|nr:beta-propeller domain-containing protein [Oscillospiraceae bacterium CM]